MNALIIDHKAANYILTRGRFSAEWFINFSQEELSVPIVRIQKGTNIYLLCNHDVPDRHFLVIRLKESGLFSDVPESLRNETFLRLIQAGLSNFDRRISIPNSWVPYRYKSLLTFYASRIQESDGRRIVIERNPLGNHDVYVENYLPARKVHDLENYELDYEAYISAYDDIDLTVEEAVASRGTKTSTFSGSTTLNAVELRETFSQLIEKGLSASAWYDLLTKEQRTFIDAPLTGPIRLRGAAGTGKTLALMIKALRIMEDAVDKNIPIRVLFLTHSWNTAEQVRRNLELFDHKGVLLLTDDNRILEITTLQIIATRALNLNDPDLQPISEDGYEGKMLQLVLVEDVLGHFEKSDWLIYRTACSSNFARAIELPKDSPEYKQFGFNLMNEFAYVIDSERSMGIDRYVTLKRTNTMLPLDNEADRRAVFHLYQQFRDALIAEKVLGVHQVMNDFLRQLDFNVWQRKREKEGYDYVFVDEFHLFNQQEAMTFQYLTRNQEPPHRVVLALDPKQSPGEAWFGLMNVADDAPGAKRFIEGLKGAKSVTLSKVFRYSVQIGALIKAINENWPGIDFSEETDTVANSAEAFHGDVPKLYVLPNAERLYMAAFSKAKAAAQSKRPGSAKVAVLCLDAARFGSYAKAGEYRDAYMLVRSRDDMESLASVGKKFVLSMPEYVAGLQFEEVFLLDANEGLLPRGFDSSLEVRRVLSNLYLGASRAEKKLHIFVTTDAGGLSRQLRPAFEKGIIITGN